MKLYQHPIAPNPRRVRIALAEKGILNDVELVTVDILNGEQNGASFIEKNPYGGLPVLELNDGTFISESVSITRYIEATVPTNPLFGNEARETALIDMWMRRIESGVLNTIATYFHQATDGLGDSRYRNKEWGQHNLKVLTKSLDILEQQLTGRVFVVGDNYSIADITLLSAIDFGLNLELVDLDKYTAISTWYKTVSQRPSAEA